MAFTVGTPNTEDQIILVRNCVPKSLGIYYITTWAYLFHSVTQISTSPGGNEIPSVSHKTASVVLWTYVH